MKQALVLCVRSDPKFNDPLMPISARPEHRTCQWCGESLLVAPSTVALEQAGDFAITYACNPCGRTEATQRGVDKLGIAPGSYAGNTPTERRRKSELLAHGFEYLP